MKKQLEEMGFIFDEGEYDYCEKDYKNFTIILLVNPIHETIEVNISDDNIRANITVKKYATLEFIKQFDKLFSE